MHKLLATICTVALLSGSLSAEDMPDDGRLPQHEEHLHGGQVPIPPPFDPYTMLDDEALDAYLLQQFQADPDGFVAAAPAPGDLAIPIQGTSLAHADDTVVVGWVSCPDIRAHYPHKGRYTGTVKTKASGYCVFRPSGQGVPPPANLMWWTLRISLISFDRGVMAIGRFNKRGWGPRWRADAAGQRGTQVDSGLCYDGTYLNLVIVLLELPPGYTGPGLVAVRTATADVKNC